MISPDLHARMMADPEVSKTLMEVADTLRLVYAHLSATDMANGAANVADVRPRPLTKRVEESLGNLGFGVATPAIDMYKFGYLKEQ